MAANDRFEIYNISYIVWTAKHNLMIKLIGYKHSRKGLQTFTKEIHFGGVCLNHSTLSVVFAI